MMINKGKTKTRKRTKKSLEQRRRERKPRRERQKHFVPDQTPESWKQIKEMEEKRVELIRKNNVEIAMMHHDRTPLFRKILEARCNDPLASMTAIAQETGAALPTVKKYWEDKDQLTTLNHFLEDERILLKRMRLKGFRVLDDAMDDPDVKIRLQAAEKVTKKEFDQPNIEVNVNQPVLTYDEFMDKIEQIRANHAQKVEPTKLTDDDVL